MTDTAEKASLADEPFTGPKMIDVVKSTHTDELIISLCGFIGTDMDRFAEILKKELETKFGYECVIKKLSEYIKSQPAAVKSVAESRYDRYQSLISVGNNMRNIYGNSILVELAIQDIHFERHEEKDNSDNPDAFKSRKRCYIINSIKNEDELELLQLVYRDIHYCFGIFSPVTMREKKLKDEGVLEEQLVRLINKDSGEDIAHGQTVRDTFTKADVFIRLDSHAKDYVEGKVNRYLQLIFGSEVITPTADETAMYLAASAAGNSACLSRQVGAALTDAKGEVISVGWNDVPKYKGNLYMSKPGQDHKNDYRCVHMNEGCWNDKEKTIISNKLVDILIEENIISRAQRDTTFQKIRNSNIKQIVEFSRAIHAEMHALIIGAQMGGSRVNGGKIYITTYPCHICARHIVVAGIKEIFYIEPYRKSLTTKLHGDSITENDEPNKVKIRMFDGVSPTRYMQLFKMHANSRKENDGTGKPKVTRSFTPKQTLSLEAIPVLESKITTDLDSKGLRKK